MQTPLPAQIEYWMKIVTDKKSKFSLKEDAILHLTNIRDTINDVLSLTIKKEIRKDENMHTRRYPHRSEKRL